jgi:hypothetical protein
MRKISFSFLLVYRVRPALQWSSATSPRPSWRPPQPPSSGPASAGIYQYIRSRLSKNTQKYSIERTKVSLLTTQAKSHAGPGRDGLRREITVTLMGQCLEMDIFADL